MRSALSKQVRGQPLALLALHRQLFERGPGREQLLQPRLALAVAAEAADPSRLRVDVAAGAVGHALVRRQRPRAVAALQAAAGQTERRARDRGVGPRDDLVPPRRRLPCRLPALARKPQRQLRGSSPGTAR